MAELNVYTAKTIFRDNPLASVIYADEAIVAVCARNKIIDELESDNAALKARIAELEVTVQRSCDLLNGCLEWDNGGERAYEKVVEFINKHDKEVGGKP